jgi:hypothetical protein
MKKDMIFFGENGLTTTSANYIANLAKEAYQNVESTLNSVAFFTTKVSLLGSQNYNTLKEGVSSSFLKDVESSLMSITELKSLIAWLREAIKAKDRVIKEASATSDEDITKNLGITLPIRPITYDRLTPEDIIATWNIKQRNRYYYLDTLCSTIGKYIHPDNGFSNAREALTKAINEPNSVNGNGRDMVIYTKVPTVSVEEVDNTFFALQNTYRAAQAELNSMKHQIDTTYQEDDREKSAKEAEESANYQAEVKAVYTKIAAYRKELVAQAQNLKIIIPDSLKPIYDKVSKMGK